MIRSHAAEAARTHTRFNSVDLELVIGTYRRALANSTDWIHLLREDTVRRMGDDGLGSGKSIPP